MRSFLSKYFQNLHVHGRQNHTFLSIYFQNVHRHGRGHGRIIPAWVHHITIHVSSSFHMDAKVDKIITYIYYMPSSRVKKNKRETIRTRWKSTLDQSTGTTKNEFFPINNDNQLLSSTL